MKQVRVVSINITKEENVDKKVEAIINRMLKEITDPDPTVEYIFQEPMLYCIVTYLK